MQNANCKVQNAEFLLPIADCRPLRDKPGGLAVAYLGLADQLKNALKVYTESGGAGSPTYDSSAAIAVMLEKYEVCASTLHGLHLRPIIDPDFRMGV